MNDLSFRHPEVTSCLDIVLTHSLFCFQVLKRVAPHKAKLSAPTPPIKTPQTAVARFQVDGSHRQLINR